jgi:SAM-dependent methyltransferase
MSFIPIADRSTYLARLRAGLHDKLRVERYLPPQATRILDVGCADGALCLAMAPHRPETSFTGIDLEPTFIGRASAQAADLGLGNARFEAAYLRQLLARPERFDAIIFASVLHEFYQYGEGLSSIIKALADAHELLRPGGAIIVRDMIPAAYMTTATLRCPSIREAIARSPHAAALLDFERVWGPATTQRALMHLLLKYPWQDNWARELPEHYVPVTLEEYTQMFALLGLTVQTEETYCLPYWRERWARECGLSDDDIAVLRSTALLVAEKRR